MAYAGIRKIIKEKDRYIIFHTDGRKKIMDKNWKTSALITFIGLDSGGHLPLYLRKKGKLKQVAGDV
jgi:hypothetical protein